MSDRRRRWRIPLIVWVGLGVSSLAGLILLAVFVPALSWLGGVLVAILAAGMAVDDVYSRMRWRQQAEAQAKEYHDEMAAFGVERTGPNFLPPGARPPLP